MSSIRPKDHQIAGSLAAPAGRPREGSSWTSTRTTSQSIAPASRAGAAAAPQLTEADLAQVTFPIAQEDDIVISRSAARELCRKLGFSTTGQTKVATAVSELARNIYQYVGRGAIAIKGIQGAPPAIEIIASDEGPGIADIDAVLSGRYKSRTGLGAGLRGVKRLMDEFAITSERGRGTVITIRKRRD